MAAGGDISLFLGGDVMTGRGIDHILPHPNPADFGRPDDRYPVSRYLDLAEARNGPVPRAVPFDYVWGVSLEVLQRWAPDLRLVNLETAVTIGTEWYPKRIDYRMNPANTGVLTAAGIDGCALANNHVLDFGRAGLLETLQALHDAGIRTAGAGRDRTEAEQPAVFLLPGKGRVLFFSVGARASGIPADWCAGADEPGINLLADTVGAAVRQIAAQVGAAKRPGDVAILSIHWGDNYVPQVPQSHRLLARGLIDLAGIDLIHGHSSHHPLGHEVYRGKLILYGCGDLINDYEGLVERPYRTDLGFIYLVRIEPGTGAFRHLTVTPVQRRAFRLVRPSKADADAMRQRLDTDCARLKQPLAASARS